MSKEPYSDKYLKKGWPFESWMNELPETFKNCSLTSLSIPGSHNTFSYTIKKNASISPDSPPLVRNLSHLCKRTANPIIYKWSLTQNIDITDQLRNGIRYLDVRVVNYKNEFYVAHGLYGEKLLPLLQQVCQFLLTHTSEITIVDFQHFYKFSEKNHIDLLHNIKEIFGTKLCVRNGQLSSLSINSMISKGEQTIVIYRNSCFLNHSFVWPSSELPTPWPNKISTSDLINFLNAELNKRKCNTGLVTQCILTVDASYVIKHPFGNLCKLATRTNSKIIPWIANHRSQVINVVITDFITTDFVSCVLEFNK